MSAASDGKRLSTVDRLDDALGEPGPLIEAEASAHAPQPGEPSLPQRSVLEFKIGERGLGRERLLSGSPTRETVTGAGLALGLPQRRHGAEVP